MSWARADALQSKAWMGKHRTGTGGMQCHQSYLWTQSSYLAHRLTTVWATANIPPWMWKAADMFRLLSPVFYFIFLRIDMMGGGGVSVNWSQGSNSTVLKKPRKLHFFKDTFAKLFSLLLLAQSHGNVFILTAVLMKGTALLLYKTQRIPHTKAFQKSFRWWWLSSNWGQPLI